MLIDTKRDDLKLRFAEREDTTLVLYFIKQLAEYERMTDEVVTTKELIEHVIFEEKKAEVIFGELNGQPVAFALFFHNYSTFLGRQGLYLEDIYVLPEYRKMGIGKLMFSYLAKLAKERGCRRMEWTCLDWNEPSINFYKQMGAVPMDSWTVYRLQDSTLTHVADLF